MKSLVERLVQIVTLFYFDFFDFLKYLFTGNVLHAGPVSKSMIIIIMEATSNRTRYIGRWPTISVDLLEFLIRVESKLPKSRYVDFRLLVYFTEKH